MKAPQRPGRILVAAFAMLLQVSCTGSESESDVASEAQPEREAEAPFEWPELRDRIDEEFRRQVEEAVRARIPQGGTAIEEGRASIVVVDITNPREPRVAEANGDLMLYAASVPKIAILLGAFVRIERGELELTDELRTQMERMIRKSSNPATNYVLERVGFERLAEILQSDRYKFYDPEHGGGLWVGRDYGGGKSWKRDPIKHLSHAASAMAVARFYYLLATGRLVSPELDPVILEVMSNPQLSHKIVGGLKEKRPDARIFRKSGTWRNFHADSGIVTVPGDYAFIVVLIGEEPTGEEKIRLFAQALDDLLDGTGQAANP
jgi:beta-lactamase class A